MDWSNLEYFLSVAREGSLSKAASKLDVNHSTVARRLDKLELDLNVKLFNRHNKGYELNKSWTGIATRSYSC
jgi:DNA-binding transcriptional LysR family regulator